MQKLNNRTEVKIRHIVVEGSSQWLIERNVTTKSDIIHTNRNYLELSIHSTFALENIEKHSYAPSYIFLDRKISNCSTFDAKLLCATGIIKESTNVHPWSELKKTIDKFHKHVCGHASLNDIKILLQRNSMWTDEVEKYLNRVINSCSDCAKTYKVMKARKVSLNSVNRLFNETICIDHCHLGNIRMFHIIDASGRYSTETAVPDTGMEAAVEFLDSHWISPFWAPSSIQFDQAFDNKEFKRFPSLHDINARPIPARRHNKNFTESKHKIVRDIFRRIKPNNDELSEVLTTQQAIFISNHLYGDDVCFSHELGKGFSRPVESGSLPKISPEEVEKAREILMA